MMIITFKISLFIFIIAFFISIYLLDIKKKEIFNNKNKFIIASFIYFVPKLCNLFLHNFFLELGFAITVITDVYEYNVFTIIPIIMIISQQIILLLNCEYTIFLYNFLYMIMITALYYAITFLSQKILNKDGFGLGDLYFLMGIIVYYNPLDFMFIFFSASLLGVIFSLIIMLLLQKYIKGLPFIPLLYIAANLFNNAYIYKLYVSVFS